MPSPFDIEAIDEHECEYYWRSAAPREGRSQHRAGFTPGSLPYGEDLPGTSDQTGKWWYVAFHNTTAIIGAGVLALPYAMKYLTWPGGVVIMILSWSTSLYTLWQLSNLHELDGHRFCRYHELGQYVFGPRRGLWIVMSCQIVVMVGLGIVYSIAGGKAMQRIYNLYPPSSGAKIGLSVWICIFGVVQMFLSLLRSFNSLSGISLLAAVMSVGYSTIAFALSVHNGRQPGTVYNTNAASSAERIFGAFSSLGIMAFAYGGHTVALEIQATLPPPPPSTSKPYMRGGYICYAIIAWCYSSVAFSGYWAFGFDAKDNILFSLDRPRGIIVFASVMVLVHFLGSFQVYTVPVYDMIEHSVLKHGWKIGFALRAAYRTVYICLIVFIAVLIPFFGDLMGFIGALATGPTTFWLPPLMWLMLKPSRTPFRKGGSTNNIHTIASWFCLIFGVGVTILGSVGALRRIVQKASGNGYRPFQ